MGATHMNVRMKKSAGVQCVAVNEAVTLLRDKWTLLVLGALAHAKTLRYRELQREVSGISQRMLTLTLKRLEASGLVKRTMFATVPPRVDYELTPMGVTLNAPLEGLLQWSLEHHDAMVEARRVHAERGVRSSRA